MESSMPQVSELFFKTAALFLVLGLMMGLQMSISGQHNVIGAHAHSNLLGWVTMAIFGGYYALNPAKAATRLARAHFWLYTLSIAVMVPALYFLYLGYGGLEPLLAVSSLTAFAAVLIFVFIVFTRPGAVAATPGAALAG
jgi:cbb3-type cytochrome oxidase subunit 1